MWEQRNQAGRVFWAREGGRDTWECVKRAGRVWCSSHRAPDGNHPVLKHLQMSHSALLWEFIVIRALKCYRSAPEHLVMPNFISLLTRSRSEGRLGMAFPVRPGSTVNLTVVVCFFSPSLEADSQTLLCKFVDIFLVLLLLPSLHNSVAS